MKLWLRLHGFEPCSWLFVWQNLAKTFVEIGTDVQDIMDPQEPENCVEVWWGDPQFWTWSGLPVMARIAIALSEARSIRTGGRESVIHNLRESDLIICPSEAATTAFREAPIDVPIKVIPFGVSPQQFRYVDRGWADWSQLKFLHAGVTQFRKGSWLVPEAFIKAFKEGNGVSLTICSPKVSPMYTQLKLEYEKHPNISFDSELKKSANVWYEAHDVYVSPHLSEGFGLCIPEAMATGMPCLVARCSAPREWFDAKYGWWIEMSEIYGPVDACLPDTSGFWRLPDVESLATVMLQAYENRSECEAKGLAASRFVLGNLTWGHTCRRILAAIQEVLDAKGVGRDDGIQRGDFVTSGLEKYQPARGRDRGSGRRAGGSLDRRDPLNA